MYKKQVWSIAAATIIELAVLTTIVYPQIGAAKRAQTPQIEKKDVVFKSRDDRPRARTEDRTRKLNTRFGEARVAGCGRWGCGQNSQIVDGAAIIACPPLDKSPHSTWRVSE